MKIDHGLFTAGQHALNQAYGECPQCGQELRVIYLNKTSFLGCSQYPNCDYTQNLTQTQVTTIKVIESSKCPSCTKPLAVKKGRYGMFIGCTDFPSCNFIASQTVEPKSTDQSCPKCHRGQLVEKQNKFGKVFIGCNTYPACKFIQK